MSNLNNEAMGQNGHQACVIGWTESGDKTEPTEQEGQVRRKTWNKEEVRGHLVVECRKSLL